MPFSIVSFLATRWFLRLFRRHIGVGPTTVEISDLPILPGKQYAYISVSVRTCGVQEFASVPHLRRRVDLSAGTDVRTERHEMKRHVVVGPSEFFVEPEKPLELDCQFTFHLIRCTHSKVRTMQSLENCDRRRSSQVANVLQKFPIVVYPRPVSQPDAANLK